MTGIFKIMPTPFIPNLRIFFKIPIANAFEISPETGNPIQLTKILIAHVWVKGNSFIAPEPGLNPNKARVKGYSVEPKILPPEILRRQVEAQAIYKDPQTGFEQPGKFILEPILDSRRPQVAQALARSLGSEIQGTFEFG